MLNPNMSNEQNLTVLLARRHMDNQTANTVKNIIEGKKINWEVFYNTCVENHVGSQIFFNLTRIPEYLKSNVTVPGVDFEGGSLREENHGEVNQEEISCRVSPSEIVGKLRLMTLLQKHRYAVITQEIQKISSELALKGIKVVIMKGHSYIHNVYKKPEERGFGDIDILIAPGDTDGVRDYLLKNGYNEVASETRSQFKSFYMNYEIRKKFKVSHLLSYTKHIGNILVAIEMHRHEHDLLNLEKIYNSSVRDNNGLYVTCLLDLFVVSCAHAWHHFYNPKACEIQMFKNAGHMNLRHLMDIRETYLECKRVNIEDETLFERAWELNAHDEAENMIKAVERVYGPLTEGNIPDNAGLIDLDWRNRYYTSYFCRRLFEPIKEDNKILGLYKKFFRPVLYSYKSDNYLCLEEGAIFIDTSDGQNSFWNTYYKLRSERLISKSTKITVSSSWNEDYLYFLFDIQLDCPYNFANRYGPDLKANYLDFYIGANENDKPTNIMLQPTKDNKLNVFINNAKVDIRYKLVSGNNGFTAFTRFPWKDINLNFTPSSTAPAPAFTSVHEPAHADLFLEVIAVNREGELYEHVCWSSGTMNYGTCNAFGKLVLVS